MNRQDEGTLDCRRRQLTKAEIRLLRARAATMRGAGRRSRSAGLWAGSAVILLLWILTMLASDAPLMVVTAFWLVVGAGIVLAVQRSLRSDGRHMEAMAAALESAIRRNVADVYDIRALAFVEFEEIEDEGACYAFALPGNRILFLHGQEFYPAAGFPSLDFSLVMPLDESDCRADMVIDKRGPAAKPLRVVPAQLKWRLDIPDDLAVIPGDLADLEQLLKPA